MLDTSPVDALTEWRYAITMAYLGRAWGRSLRGVTVLDVGRLSGFFADRLRQAEARVIAVTLVTDAAFEARMHARGIGIFVRDVEATPLPATDGSIDMALCCELIEHLPARGVSDCS